MGNTQNLLVKITGDSSSFKSAMSDVSTQTKSTQTSLSKLGAAVAAGNIATDALGAGFHKAAGFMSESVEAANSYQAAMLGLTSISRAYGVDANGATEAAKKLASDGLLTVSQAALGLKNLLATGFSLPEAINLMNNFKDSAAFGRQASLSFGDAVTSSTEGLKNGNSILLDNGGITKNLSVILQQHGKSVQDVMNISSDASVRQAAYNGLLQEGAATTGNAAKLTQTYAGAQARASAQTKILEQNVGSIVQAISQPLVQAFGNFLATNQQMIVSMGAAALAAGGVVGGLFLVIRAIQAFSVASLIAAATNPLLAALTVLGAVAGFTVYKAVDKLQGKVATANNTFKDTGKTLGTAVPEGAGKSSKAMDDLGEKLADIDAQMKKTNRDFTEQLADMVASHQQKVKDLSSQLSDENATFKEKTDKETSDYRDAQLQMADEHTKKVASIQKQITQLQSLGKSANQEDLDDLRKQLADENATYAADTAKKQADMDAQTAKEKADHDKKVTDLQAQLDAENALLSKHAGDVAAVKGATMLDEIDKLKRTHDEQIAAYEDQKNKAIKSSQDATAGVSSSWAGLADKLNANTGPMDSAGKALGTAMGNAMKQAFKEALQDVGKSIVNIAKTTASKINPATYFNQLRDALSDSSLSSLGMRASGGPVNANTPYVVGEAGQEVFVPQVPGTILSAGDTRNMLSSSNANSTQSVTNHVANFSINLDLGMYVGMPSEKREIASSIWVEIVRLARSQGVQLPQIGIQTQ